MAELLIELFSEEIPARMQTRAGADFARQLGQRLSEAGLAPATVKAYTGARRIAVVADGLARQTEPVTVERKGPRANAPAAAIDGFLRSAGVSRDECTVVEDKKGAFLLARTEKPGRPASDIIAEIVPALIAGFSWPKSMRWGSGKLRWVRPLRSLMCLFDGEVVNFSLDGLASGGTTRGHRFMAPASLSPKSFSAYRKQLNDAFVMIDAGEREATILSEARALAATARLELIEDKALLAENAGLVEWPVVLMGEFDPTFLSLPAEVITTAIRTHQKCLALNKPDGGLANRYILVANLLAKDGGEAITTGNNRVIAARLEDARFFYDQDCKAGLSSRLDELEGVTFHARLGSQAKRARRIATLAGEIADLMGIDRDVAAKAAGLAKADLVTGMVGEFPELQGVMGGYYALAEGLGEDIAGAIRDHYKPQGPADSLPQSPYGQAVALADKLDMLAGFWVIDEKPTGSRDPYGLRRAALGVVRIILENDLRFDLKRLAGEAIAAAAKDASDVGDDIDEEQIVGDLMAFIAERLKVHLREDGVRHDLIDAVFCAGGGNDIAMLVKRVRALERFLASDDGATLLAGVKRAANILRIEEKKDGVTYRGDPNPALLIKGEEKALASAVRQAEANARKAITEENFEGAMAALAKLRQPVDDFFDQVTVNDDDRNFRENRLVLLNRVREATGRVCDFSRIEG